MTVPGSEQLVGIGDLGTRHQFLGALAVQLANLDREAFRCMLRHKMYRCPCYQYELDGGGRFDRVNKHRQKEFHPVCNLVDVIQEEDGVDRPEVPDYLRVHIGYHRPRLQRPRESATAKIGKKGRQSLNEDLLRIPFAKRVPEESPLAREGVICFRQQGALTDPRHPMHLNDGGALARERLHDGAQLRYPPEESVDHGASMRSLQYH